MLPMQIEKIGGPNIRGGAGNLVPVALAVGVITVAQIVASDFAAESQSFNSLAF